MRYVLGSVARLVATLAALAVVATLALPPLMANYRPFSAIGGLHSPCPASGSLLGAACGRTLSASYNLPLDAVILETSKRSLALLLGAALLSLTVGLLLGVAIALARHRAWQSGGLLGLVSLLAAVPSFFAAYFLQIVAIFVGGAVGHTVLPVFGYGLDEHIVLPLVAIALPAVATTAQLASTRFAEVLDADFVRTANAKGLWPSWILRVHVLPHVLPVALEAVGSGLRVSVASLPIVEYLFVWNGLGFAAIQALGGKDVAGLTACVLVLGGLFVLAGTLADARRLRAA